MWAAYFPEDSEQNSSGTSSKTSSEHIFVHMCMCACIYVHVSIHTYTDDMRGHNLVGHLNKIFFFYRIKRHEGQPETIWYGPWSMFLRTETGVFNSNLDSYMNSSLTLE